MTIAGHWRLKTGRNRRLLSVWIYHQRRNSRKMKNETMGRKKPEHSSQLVSQTYLLLHRSFYVCFSNVCFTCFLKTFLWKSYPIKAFSAGYFCQKRTETFVSEFVLVHFLILLLWNRRQSPIFMNFEVFDCGSYIKNILK